jgi:hypothetical protein
MITILPDWIRALLDRMALFILDFIHILRSQNESEGY